MIQRLVLIWLFLMFFLNAGKGICDETPNRSPDYLSFKTEDETNNIEIFRKASQSVVYVTNKAYRRDMFSFNVYEIPSGSGSGFIWDDKGTIVTNFHVVQNADRVTITLQDQTSWDAKVVGLAPEKDIAVLRIEAPENKFIPLPLGESRTLEVGRKVLAIGNPFGLDTTLTVGVVSALGREINSMTNRVIHDVIQTDAAINPGNSGGPLLNSLGQLIGINTAIFSPSGANVGIGFAIPVDTVKKIVPQLIKYGKLFRPVIGIEMVPDNFATRYGIEGVIVLRATRGFPAETAGLKGIQRDFRGNIVLGDIIVAIDGNTVTNSDSMLTILEEYKPGDTVTVTTDRKGEKRSFRIKLSSP
ncbi:MAG: trypsin-like peptidase domain-containing protein [Proteobacteria bacterium]|nr:trypsin-like peptidase domain-containing protein [Pseudomonadota bacterium]